MIVIAKRDIFYYVHGILSQLTFESILFSDPMDGTFINSDEHFDITLSSQCLKSDGT